MRFILNFLTVSRDNFLAYQLPPQPDVGVTIVSTEDGKEINSMDDLRDHVQQKHRFLLIKDDALGYMQLHNRDRTYRLAQELVSEVRSSGKKKTLRKWEENRTEDLKV